MNSRVLAAVAVALVIALSTFLIQRGKPISAPSLTGGVVDRVGDLRHVEPSAQADASLPASFETVGSGECFAEIKPEAKLGSGDRCALELMAKRCGSLDACFVKCFASGSARNIGGGCYHMCNYSLWKPWSLPDGFEKCYAPGEANHLD